MATRNVNIDIVRALCAIEIIAFWHLIDYLPESYALAGLGRTIGEELTYISLGGFSFISGYCLSKYACGTLGESLKFYKRRLIRFYPLFLLSALSFLAAKYIFGHGWFMSNWQFVGTITGVASFFPPVPMTLWYFSMIMLFYLVTPFILHWPKTVHKAVAGLLIMGLFIGINAFHKADYTLFLYYPFYLAGLLYPSGAVAKVEKHGLPFTIGSLLVLVAVTLSGITDSGVAKMALNYLTIIAGITFLFAVSSFLAKSAGISRFLGYVSYASMVAYLFHRQFYHIARILFGSGADKSVSIFTAVMTAVFIFAVSYGIQYIYDKITSAAKPAR